MRFFLGKFLELIGMVVILVGLVGGIQYDFLFKYELYCFAGGCVLFIVGWLLEKPMRGVN